MGVVGSNARSETNRLSALRLFLRDLDQQAGPRVLRLAQSIDDGAVLAALIRELGKHPQVDAESLLVSKLGSNRAEVRAAAISSLAVRNSQIAGSQIAALLNDQEIQVQLAAVRAAGKLGLANVIPRLTLLADSKDHRVCQASLESLTRLKAPNVIGAAVAALQHSQTQLAALAYLRHQGVPQQISHVNKVAKSSRSSDVLRAVIETIATWKERQAPDSDANHQLSDVIGRLQGTWGVAMYWSSIGPVSAERAARIIQEFKSQPHASTDSRSQWRKLVATGAEAVLHLPRADDGTDGAVWLATSEVILEEQTLVEFLGSCNGTFQVWVNDESILEVTDPAPFKPDAVRGEVTLSRGTNRLLIKVAGIDDDARFHLRFRRKSSLAEHERLTQLLLEGRGNVQRGRDVFFDAEKSLCLKCHRLGDVGARIGPDLSSIGSQFARIHLIESILEPNRSIAPSYSTVSVTFSDGRVLTGVKFEETDDSISLGDSQGKQHVIPKRSIETTILQDRSSMPDGLEKRLTDTEMMDLIAFLLSRKNHR